MGKRRTIDGTKFLRYFGPLLNALRTLGGSGSPDEVVEQIANDMSLTDEEQNELVPSGGSRLKTNVAWARFYLVREGLLDSSKRGVWSLTEKGRATQLTVDRAGEIFSRWVSRYRLGYSPGTAGCTPLQCSLLPLSRVKVSRGTEQLGTIGVRFQFPPPYNHRRRHIAYLL